MGKVWMPGGGGGADLDAVTAESPDVLAGKVIVDKDGEPLTGTLAFSGDASSDQVLAGRSYYSTDPKNKQTGSMPNYSSTPTAIDAIRINNNRFEVAVARGFHGYNWAGGGYEYMSYDQVANSIGLTPAKLKKGEWVCGRTGTFEGYVPTATDLYLRGNNIAGFVSKNTSAINLSFESGQITIGTTNLPTDNSLYAYAQKDLTGYNYLNVEGYCSTGYNSGPALGISVASGTNASAVGGVDAYAISPVGVGYKTVTLNISAINAIRYIRVFVIDRTSAYVYRIWFS
jgi:hypothetical protein